MAFVSRGLDPGAGVAAPTVGEPLPAARGVPNRVVMDHRVPVVSGGSHGMENIALACHACNAKKSDRDADA